MKQGEAIREARVAACMTQEHLAKAAGVSEKTVRRAERGDRISAENVMALCACLGLDAANLPLHEGIARTVEPGVTGGQSAAPDASSHVNDPTIDAVPVVRPALSHVGPRPGWRGIKPLEAFLAAAIVSVAWTGVGVWRDELSRKDEYASEVQRTAQDTSFIALAHKAGYRIEVQDGPSTPTLVARCVRANDAGPVPCDPAPRPAGKVGAGMAVMTGNGEVMPSSRPGFVYICPGMC